MTRVSLLRNRVLILACVIPLISVALGIAMIFLAADSSDTWIEPTMLPLSKTNP
jgi:hypothetical protein